ncbi:MAG TPA: transglycosylase SLT domain-containing protein [Burkholderiales bacterium]|nr:transglycosylase SLT domain-containing protein [Burkholderiales bacterium]
MPYYSAMNKLPCFNDFSCQLSRLLLLCLSLPLSVHCLADTAAPVSAPVTDNRPARLDPAAGNIAKPNSSNDQSSAAVSASTPAAQQEPNPDAPIPLTNAPGDTQNDITIQNAADNGPVDLWSRIRKGFALKDSDSPLVETHIEWYASRPDYVSRMVERSRRYLFHILGEVEKRGMPTEIALLPMVESAYNPMAYSSSQASGIWQFIPATGKLFGLKQNGWYDGRRDIVAATDAALDYLTKLHTEFGTWELALAAYNCGEGCVEHAIAKNQALGLPTDYSSLNLPLETRHYVPKLLAIKQIVADPESVGLNLDSIPDQAYFTAVTLKRPIDVSLAAKLANMPVRDFISLNPAYNKPVVRSDTPTQLLLPVDRVDTFSTNLQNCTEPLVSWQMYRARLGERIRTIAKKFHVSVAWLMEHNPIHLSHKGKLTSEHTLIVPLRNQVANAAKPADIPGRPVKLAENDTAAAKPLKIGYRETNSGRHADDETPGQIKVKPGDTLYSIARRYRVSLQDLKKWNHTGNRPLQPGATLSLAASSSRHPTSRQHRHHKNPSTSATAKTKKMTVRKQRVS